MIYAIPVNKRVPGNRRLVRGAVWFLLFLLLLSVYGRWLIAGTPEQLRPIWNALGPLVLLTDFLNPAFSGRFLFFLLCTVGLAACGLFWIAERRARIGQVIPLAILGALLASPFAVTQMYGPYTLRSVDVVQGYELNWLTQPQGYFASAFKSAQRAHDIDGCRYRLHGWGGDNRFYYGSECGNDLWLYDPQSGDGPQRIKMLPGAFSAATEISATLARPRGEDTLWVTRIVEEATSADGMFRAAVIQDSFYGPFDVIVMRRADPLSTPLARCEGTALL